MAKSPNLKSRLKAADRRRRRRTAADVQRRVTETTSTACAPDAHSPATKPDVAAILVDAALTVANENESLTDSAVIGALRAIKHGSGSKSPTTESVFREMVRRLDQAGISAAERAHAAGDLLGVVATNVDPGSKDRLITFLSLIASDRDAS